MPLVAGIAQLVEQWTENPRVGGSSPPPGIVGSCRLLWVDARVVNGGGL